MDEWIIELMDEATEDVIDFTHPFSSRGVVLNSFDEALTIIRERAHVPPIAKLHALVLLQRLLDQTELRLTSDSCLIMYLISLCISCKLYLDVPYNTVSFRTVSGGRVSAVRMYELEVLFLNMLAFDVLVTDEQFEEMEIFLHDFLDD